MNNAERGTQPERDGAEDEARGANLTLIYSLVGLALVAAVAIALLIVFPFYLRR